MLASERSFWGLLNSYPANYSASYILGNGPKEGEVMLYTDKNGYQTFRDDNGFMVDSTGDGGDGANREGIYTLFSEEPAVLSSGSPTILSYQNNGEMVRHPNQVPWNNPLNFTRDQTIPYVAGLRKIGRVDIVRKILFKTILRAFFCQDFQRDYPGTWKKPYPTTYVDQTNGQTVHKNFDFADPIMPDGLMHLILCSRFYPLYLFGIIGYPWLVISIAVHCLTSTDNDEGQVISQAVVAGKPFVWLYKKLKPNYKESLLKYWVTDRQQNGIYQLVINAIG